MSKCKSVIDIERLAEALKALSNPNRLKIFMRLVDCCCGEISCEEDKIGACVSELGEGMEIAPSTLSHHIRELRIAGLLTQERKGKEIFCCVDESVLEKISTFFDELKK